MATSFESTFAHQPEKTPLRRRENDSFAAPTYRTGSISELPILSHQKRRVRRESNPTERMVRFTMNFILFSPAIVLAIWGVVLITTKPTASTARGAVRVPARPHSAKQSHHGKGHMIPVINPLGAEAPMSYENMEERQEMLAGSSFFDGTILRPRPHPLPRDEGPQIFIQHPPATNSQPATFSGLMQPQPIQGPPGFVSQNGQMIQLPLQQTQGMMMQPQPMQGAAFQPPPVQGQNMMMQPQPMQGAAFQPPPLQGQTMMMQQPMQGAALQSQNSMMQPMQGAALQSQNSMMQPMQGAALQSQNAMMRSQSQSMNRRPIVQPEVQYYYYDPSQTTRDSAGNLVLPDTVYDGQGRPLPLARLQQNAVVQQDPPPRGVFHHDNFTNNDNVGRINVTFTHPNTVRTPVKDKHREASLSMLKIPTPAGGTDQNIIVGTVGVMALLVGALSARRLRSKGVLSVCMDDENLQDDAAYDTAYTTSGSYNTFAWKGDLEKFDV